MGLNLKKLFVFEIAAVIAIVLLVAVFISLTPYLSSSQNGQIGVYNQREYAQKTVTTTMTTITPAISNTKSFLRFNPITSY